MGSGGYRGLIGFGIGFSFVLRST